MDHRETALHLSKWYDSINERDMTAFLSESEQWIPIEFAVCPVCEGKGKHVDPAIDSQGIGAEQFAEDPTFERDYHRGVYDVTCNGCGGRRVIPVPRDQVDKDSLAKWEQEQREYLEEVEAERRMGA